MPELQALLPYLHLSLLTFGRWDEVLARPIPGDDLPFAVAMVEYARGVALAARGQEAEANTALQRLQQLRSAPYDEVAGAILEIAYHALAGEIDGRAGRTEGAIRHFRQAAAVEDALPYMEPPFWYYPIRHSLGRWLLEQGAAAEAERVYREDLARFPENGWSLRGLTDALNAQGRAAEAADAERRFAAAWDRSDVTLVSSRF